MSAGLFFPPEIWYSKTETKRPPPYPVRQAGGRKEKAKERESEMIRTIVFDMGNVLLRYSPVEIVRSVLGSHPREDDLVRAVFGAPEWSSWMKACSPTGEAAAAMAARSPGA